MSASIVSIEEFRAILKAQNVPTEQLQFICPHCQTVQSAQDFINAGVSDWEPYIAYSCIGRFSKEKGCDWTLGGLFQIAKLFVIDDEGLKHPRFLPVNFEQGAGVR